MNNKDALKFVDFWLRELMHVGHKNVEEKTKILKIIKREITMGITAGFIKEDEKYFESGMAKLMGERFPELKIKKLGGFTICADTAVNGLKEIGEFIEKNPMSVTYADYIHWTKLVKYFSTRKVDVPIPSLKKFINYQSNIDIVDGKFTLTKKDV